MKGLRIKKKDKVNSVNEKRKEKKENYGFSFFKKEPRCVDPKKEKKGAVYTTTPMYSIRMKKRQESNWIIEE